MTNWTFGHSDIWTFGHLDIWTFGQLGEAQQRHFGIGVSELGKHLGLGWWRRGACVTFQVRHRKVRHRKRLRRIVNDCARL